MQIGHLTDSSGSSIRDLDQGEHIYKPKWHKLLDAVVHALVSRLHKSRGRPLEQSDGGLAPQAFICEGDIDGITTSSGREARAQVTEIFRPFIDSLDLTEKDTGAVIIGLHFFMQREGLPAAPSTWRILAIAAILATLQLMFRNSHKGRSAREKLLASIEGWCPKPRATAACEALTQWLPPADIIQHFEAEGLRTRKRDGSSSGDTDSRGESASSESPQGNPRQQAAALRVHPEDDDECGVASI